MLSSWVPETISVLAAGLTVFAARACLHFISTCRGTDIPSAGLFESSVRYSAKAKYRPNEVPLGDFNLKIKHENVDIMN